MNNTISTFKQLNKKQKLQFIWDYYKFHIFFTLVLILIAISITRGIIANKSVQLHVAYINVAASDDMLSEINDSTSLNIENYKDMLITEDPSSENLEYAYASASKLIASISAGDLDIIIADSYGINHSYSSEYLCDLSDYLGQLDPELLEELKPYFIYDGDVPYAINLSFSPIFNNVGYSEDIYLGIVPTGKNQEHIITYLKGLF